MEEGWAGILDVVAPTHDLANERIRILLQVAVTRGLSLERSNPTRKALTEDFGRLGIDLTSQGSSRSLWKHPRNSLDETWKQMERLNTWRNAIAHHDFNFNDRVLKLLDGVTSPGLREVRVSLRACDRLAGFLDASVRHVWADLAATSP